MKSWEGFKFLINKPFRLFFVIAGLTLFFGLSQLHTSYELKDTNYTETTGEICNVRSKKVLVRGSFRYDTRYWYDLRWYADGEVYEKHFEEQFYRRSEGEVTIWVSEDNRNALFTKPVENGETENYASTYLSISLVTGLIAIALYWIHVSNRKESREEKIERLTDNEIGGIILFVLCLFGIGIVAVDIVKDYQKGDVIPAFMFDILIAFVVGAVISLVVFLVSKKELDG